MSTRYLVAEAGAELLGALHESTVITERVDIDATGLDFIDAGGLAELVALQHAVKAAGIELRTIHAPAHLRRLCSICDLETVLGLPASPDAEPVSDVDPVDLVASSEPAVVFASLAANCLPDVCDKCTIDVIEDDQAGYRVEYPPQAAATPDDRSLHIRFVAERTRSGRAGYRGVATFGWHHRQPTRADRMIADALIQNAIRTIAWQRSDQHADDLTTQAEHLTSALNSSRRIGAAMGILMSNHKITDAKAFDLLRVASQESHRKLRDLALEVIETGCLDHVPGRADGAR